MGAAEGRMLVAPDGGATILGVAGTCAAAVVYGVDAPAAQRVAEGLRIEAP
jgi:hypothetical protein